MIMTIKCFCSRLLSDFTGKSFHKRAVLLLVLAGLLTHWGRGRYKGREVKEIKIGVCMHNETEIFTNSIIKNMQEYARKKEKENGIKVTLDVVSAKDNQLTQNDQVEEFITKGYDVLCVNLVDRSDATLVIDKAMSSNTPIVFFNRELVEEDLDRWDKLYYVGAPAEQSGRLQADIIIDKFIKEGEFDKYDVNHNGTIQYIMLEGETRHQDAIIRTRVVTSELSNRGISLEKLGDEFANWDRNQAKTKVRALIEKYPFQIEMVIANNDEMALGAIEAFEETKYPIDPFIIGIDGTEEGLEAVRVGKLNGSVFNDAKGQAKTIMRIALALAEGSDIPSDITLYFGKYAYLPYTKITYDNVQQYLNR